MQQFPTIHLSIAGTILFAGYMEHMFWPIPIQLLRHDRNAAYSM